MYLALLAIIAAASPPATKIYPAIFRSCYDGDTCSFDLVLSDVTSDIGAGITQRIVIVKTDKVRLCDINAPEIKPGPNPAAIKARDDLTKWISSAKALMVEVPQKPNCVSGAACDKVEKYGRLLGYVIADGVNLNERQLATGNAVPFMACR